VTFKGLSTLVPETTTKSPVSGYKASCFGNKCGQAFTVRNIVPLNSESDSDNDDGDDGDEGDVVLMHAGVPVSSVNLSALV